MPSEGRHYHPDDDADISSRTKKGRTATLPGPLNIGSRELSRAIGESLPLG
jgi:hypothetical protein